MDKVKYEKPMLVELGFDSEVMGTRCQNGPANSPQCKSGPTARAEVSHRHKQALPSVCNAGWDGAAS